MVKAVLFDIGNTLDVCWASAESKNACLERVMNVLESRKIISYGRSAGRVSEMFFAGMFEYIEWTSVSHRSLKPEEIVRDFALRQFDLSTEEALLIGEDLCQAFTLLFYWRSPKADVVPMLQGLKDLGLKLGIVSNTSGLYSMYNELRDMGIRRFFDNITLSSIVGYEKPDPHIFEIAMCDLEVTPAECVMIGDNMIQDIQGAQNVGITKCIQVVPSEDKLTGELPQVVRLSAIPNIVKGWLKGEDC